MKVFYFTGTGNSLYVAKSFGGEAISIKKALESGEKVFKDEKIGIVFPCYFFGTPRIVKNFLEKVTLEADYIFAIMTYGGNNIGMNDFIKTAPKNNIAINYSKSILMVDNYLPIYEMGKQIESVGKKDIENNLLSINNDVENKLEKIEKGNVLGTVVLNIAQGIYNKSLDNGDKKFSTDDQCDRCKICEKACPVDNIEVEDKPIFKHNCELCLACIHCCPQNAIHHKKEKSSKRFINPNISLIDIIKSNETVKK